MLNIRRQLRRPSRQGRSCLPQRLSLMPQSANARIELRHRGPQLRGLSRKACALSRRSRTQLRQLRMLDGQCSRLLLAPHLLRTRRASC